MAVPTLSAVSPTWSRTGGLVLARLTGTGFRLPAAPPLTGRAPAQAPSIAVRFGDELSPDAYAVSATEAFALVPSRKQGTVDITLQNLDDAGVAIPGELATLTAAFTFRMPDLSREGPVAVIVRHLLRRLKREVLDNVSVTTHTEYDADTGDALSVIDVGKLPAIVLVGPRLPENRSFSLNAPRYVAQDGLVYRLRPSRTVDVEFTVTAATDHSQQAQNLMAELSAFFQRNAYLEVLDQAHGTLRYEMAASFAGMETATRASESNLRQFSGDIIIRGVDLDEEDMRIAVTKPVAALVPADVASTTGIATGGADAPLSYTADEYAALLAAGAFPAASVGVAEDAATGGAAPAPPPADLDLEQIPPGGAGEA